MTICTLNAENPLAHLPYHSQNVGSCWTATPQEENARLFSGESDYAKRKTKDTNIRGSPDK